MSKSSNLIKNWSSYMWISEMALTVVICVARGISANLRGISGVFPWRFPTIHRLKTKNGNISESSLLFPDGSGKHLPFYWGVECHWVEVQTLGWRHRVLVCVPRRRSSIFTPFSAELIEIVSQLQLLAAVNRAVHDEHYGQMRTKHLHSEIVYALAATQNVHSPENSAPTF